MPRRSKKDRGKDPWGRSDHVKYERGKVGRVKVARLSYSPIAKSPDIADSVGYLLRYVSSLFLRPGFSRETVFLHPTKRLCFWPGDRVHTTV